MEQNEPFTWQLAFFLVGSLLVIGTVVAVVAWQFFATSRARAAIAREQAYQRLAESTAASLEQLTGELHQATEQLQATREDLTDLRQRTTEMERILKEV